MANHRRYHTMRNGEENMIHMKQRTKRFTFQKDAAGKAGEDSRCNVVRHDGGFAAVEEASFCRRAAFTLFQTPAGKVCKMRVVTPCARFCVQSSSTLGGSAACPSLIHMLMHKGTTKRLTCSRPWHVPMPVCHLSRLHAVPKPSTSLSPVQSCQSPKPSCPVLPKVNTRVKCRRN